ncbi:hypothetical protein BRADI_4g42270v3 [Brachypodium distachyon]|uniref:Uncharacterized protein n=1 Tax=Brachypodium distachyon TaxID=15368 RepID=A0A0Q3HVF1_BRADI|nr:hypothetical protein BRADI_4g42270v3 [Brachypodium distachyon]
MAKATAALLPALLPTPPSMITPSPCVIILPAASNPKFPKPGRADAAERWDAHKKDDKTTKPRSVASSFGSSSPGRADSVDRWDINKKKIPGSSSTLSSSSSTLASSSSSKNPGRVPSCEMWDRNKRPPSRASSADRWDALKKPRPAAQPDGEQEEQKKTIVDKEAPEDETTSKKMIATAARTPPVFSGPSFVASPEPSMLPMPASSLAAPAFFPCRRSSKHAR